MKAKEPTATPYASHPLVDAMKRNINFQLSQVNDVDTLSAIINLLADKQKDYSFAERYQCAKEKAQSCFPAEIFKELEAKDFYINQPFPIDPIETPIDFAHLIDEYEASSQEGASHEQLKQMLDKWLSE